METHKEMLRIYLIMLKTFNIKSVLSTPPQKATLFEDGEALATFLKKAV